VPLLGRLLRFNFAINFLTYCAIVGAMYGVRLYSQARRRELATAQLEASLAATRLEVLRAQLNPHFLFNTLNAISVLAMKGQHAAVTDTLARLGELLRVSLDDTRPHQVPLSDEVEFLGGYLEILRLRFGNRMVVDQAIEDDALDALVPCMLLQPVVENAIVHGISARPGEGRIVIDARRMEERLVLQVSDNGPGFGASTARGHGIGLRNTRARLEQIYGTSQRLELIDGPEGGAIVRISIPFLTAGALAVPA
jgi:sensor histidine kinase YesM